MSHYFKLLALEVRRFRFVLAGMMLYTMIVEGLALAQQINSYNNRFGLKKMLSDDGSEPPGLSFTVAIVNTQRGFALAIVFPLAVLLAYVLLVWYRDWFGRHPFIYRQLMVPGGRTPLYFAKLTAVLLFVFWMIAWQLLLMVGMRLEYVLLAPEWMKEPIVFTDAMYASRVFQLLLPIDISGFLINYGCGILFVLLVFAGILFERSYRIRGLLIGILYLTLNVGLFIYSTNAFAGILYPNEQLAVWLTIFGLEVAAAIWISLKLINRNVSV